MTKEQLIEVIISQQDRIDELLKVRCIVFFPLRAQSISNVFSTLFRLQSLLWSLLFRVCDIGFAGGCRQWRQARGLPRGIYFVVGYIC